MNRKFITHLLLVLICVFLVACGGATQPETIRESISSQTSGDVRDEPRTDKGSDDSAETAAEVAEEVAEVVREVAVEKEVEVIEEEAMMAETDSSSASEQLNDSAMVEAPITDKFAPAPQPTAAPMATAPAGAAAVIAASGSEQLSDDAMVEAPITDKSATAPTGVPPTVVAEQDNRAEVIVQEGRKNPFIDTRDDNLSTFAIDVDTGSYTLMRSYLGQHRQLPPAGNVRAEEYINYFDQQYPQPESGAFAVHIEAAPAPYGESDAYHLARVGIQGIDVSAETRPDVMLIFVIDVSGSMNDSNRLSLAKESLRLLVDSLYITDRVGIVVYGTNARIVLEPTRVENRFEILDAIDSVYTEGSTNVEAGIDLGYSLANSYALDGEETRLIVMSDGVANVGDTTASAILENAKRGISLSTFGFGLGSYNDGLMEQLANDGDGVYAYIDTLREAQRIFEKELTGTLITIAKDAKVQVEFNPAVVEEYRLIGYENRAVADSDFRNDRIDAGEIGAGHSVTALYEMRLAPNASLSDNAFLVRLRYQDLDSNSVNELIKAVTPSQFASSISETSPTFQLTATVAEYAEILSGSYWASGNSISDLYNDVDRVATMFPRDNQVQQFVSMVEVAARIGR